VSDKNKIESHNQVVRILEVLVSNSGLRQSLLTRIRRWHS